MIIVTGATGFVGRYLVDHLVNAGEKVIAAGRSRKYDAFFKELGIPFVPLDVSNPDSFSALPAGPVKAFIHLAAVIPAAVTDVRTPEFISINTIGTFNALEYCRRVGVNRFINTTTRFEVDDILDLPIRESMGRRYQYTGDHTAYVISKVAAAEYVEHYKSEFGIGGLTLRLTGLYGAGRYKGFTLNGNYHPYAIEVFVDRACKGQNLEVWGKPIARDNLYVKDAVEAIFAALRGDKADGTYNVASGRGATLEDYARAIVGAFSPNEKPSRIVLRPEIETSGEPYIFDVSKMERDFGWKSRYTLEQAMADYRQQLERQRISGVAKPTGGPSGPKR